MTEMSNTKRAKIALAKMTNFDKRLLKGIAEGSIVHLYDHPDYGDSIEWLEGFELIMRDGNQWVLSLAGNIANGTA